MGRLLDTVECPRDMRRLGVEELTVLAQEVREEVISVVSEVGGHLASTLGAVELTLALHYAFNPPEDRIVWDTGHQAYAHKLICGRRNRLGTIRQLGGLSGFLSREESEYDVFGAGHAGTSISAALGMVEAKTLEGSSRKVVAVISDGGLSAGLTFEGLNQAGHLEKDLIVILNDNEIFIDPRVGAVSSFLSKQFTTDFGVRIQKHLSSLVLSLPKGENLRFAARKLKDSFLGLVTPGFLFESLGFQYVGPIDGHNISEMITTLENVKKIEGPTLVHVLTKKGKGYPPAAKDPVKYHSVTPFHVLTGKAKKEKGSIPTYTEVFARALIKVAKDNPKVVGITAAMGSGTGIDKLSKEIPGRSYDVGIAEQHAVTFAAGMATEGYVPVVAIYSTFLQRSVDQLFQEIALIKTPVLFCLDRAGLVGEDGETHMGLYDIAYLLAVPDVTVTAPRDATEMLALLRTAANHTDGAFTIRYPRDTAPDVPPPMANIEAVPYGTWDVVRRGSEIAILAEPAEPRPLTPPPGRRHAGQLVQRDGHQDRADPAFRHGVLRLGHQHVGHPLRMDARRIHGGGGVHAEVDYINDHLRRLRDDVGPARAARDINMEIAGVLRDMAMAHASPHGRMAYKRAAQAVLVQALERSPDFLSAALPRKLFPPRFNRYTGGGSFPNPGIAHKAGDWRNCRKEWIKQVYNYDHGIDAALAVNEGSTAPHYYSGPLWAIFDQDARKRGRCTPSRSRPTTRARSWWSGMTPTEAFASTAGSRSSTCAGRSFLDCMPVAKPQADSTSTVSARAPCRATSRVRTSPRWAPRLKSSVANDQALAGAHEQS